MSFSIIAASQDDWVPTQIYQALTLDNRSYLGIGAHQHSRLAELSRAPARRFRNAHHRGFDRISGG